MNGYKNFLKYMAALAVAGMAFSAVADEITDARDMIDAGDLAAARRLLQPLKSNYEALTLLGHAAAVEYNFEEAARLYKQAENLSRRNKNADTEELERLRQQLSTAENFLERVEQLQVIDSITVPKEDFFRSIRIPESAGHLSSGDAFPIRGKHPEYFYASEGNDYMIWSEPDSLYNGRLMEAIRLTDGSWGAPQALDEGLGGGGSAEFPFMMSDGVTLYYAADGDESIGGLDIFVATRDAATGEFLQPQNLGMPYSSPSDDYMLAIDELNGIGWLATDRNLLGDKLTLYVFLTNDLRKNYEPDTDNLLGYAKISDIAATQDPAADYSEAREVIERIRPSGPAKANDFYFPIRPGVVYTSMGDFKTAKGQNLMKIYLKALEEQNHDLEYLKELRTEYRTSPTEHAKKEILQLESKTEKAVAALRKMKGEVRMAELQ